MNILNRVKLSIWGFKVEADFPTKIPSWFSRSLDRKSFIGFQIHLNSKYYNDSLYQERRYRRGKANLSTEIPKLDYIEINKIHQASGNLGSQILAALLRNKQFNVTVLSRSARSFPADVQVKPVDFASLDELTTALVGQDAVIDSTSAPEVETPVRLIEAAAQAGVYRLFVVSSSL